jgi:hypothetical protein
LVLLLITTANTATVVVVHLHLFYQQSQIGHELDQLERQMLDAEAQAAAGPSSNLDESGMFSIQVLTKALQVREGGDAAAATQDGVWKRCL